MNATATTTTEDFFALNEIEFTSPFKRVDYVYSTLLGLLVIVGIIGNIIYIYRNFKTARMSVSSKIKDIQRFALVLAIFNIAMLPTYVITIYAHITKDHPWNKKWLRYVFSTYVFTAGLGAIYALLCLAKETHYLTRISDALTNKSNRFEMLVEGMLYWGIAVILICGGLIMYGWHPAGESYIPEEEMFIAYYSFEIVFSIAGLTISIVAFVQARKSTLTFAEDSSTVKFVAAHNLKLSVLYNTCLVTARVYYLGNILFYWSFSSETIEYVLYKSVSIFSVLCFVVFPFICKLNPPRKFREMENARDIPLVESG